MKSTSESLSHPETSNGRAAECNCVVVRRGGEQPEADLRGKTKTMNSEEEPSAPVPAGDKQTQEDLWQRHKAERRVWSNPMLVALERGLKGNKWFSLIDKVRSTRTLELAWEKVRVNAGPCGGDGITIDRFAKACANCANPSNPRRGGTMARGSHRGGHQPDAERLVWILQACPPQRVG
jgi:hypothetical protein